MENASKALIIAGAILLSILIIGLGMFIYQMAADSMNGASLDPQKVQSYNAPFLQYENTQSGTSVRTLCDQIRNHNNTKSDDTSMQIGIIYGSDGIDKADESKIDTEVPSTDVAAVKAKIKSGKTYTVQFHMAKSGLIISATITDKATK